MTGQPTTQKTVYAVLTGRVRGFPGKGVQGYVRSWTQWLCTSEIPNRSILCYCPIKQTWLVEKSKRRLRFHLHLHLRRLRAHCRRSTRIVMEVLAFFICVIAISEVDDVFSFGYSINSWFTSARCRLSLSKEKLIEDKENDINLETFVGDLQAIATLLINLKSAIRRSAKSRPSEANVLLI